MKNRCTALLVLVCMLFGLVSMCSAAAAESITVYVASNTLKVYQKATSSSKLLGTMAFAEKMTCTATKGSWAQVKNGDGSVGYCRKSGLTTENPNTLSEEVYLNRSGVKVYRKPSTSADVMTTVEDNLSTTYTAVAATEDGEWIRLQNGKYFGYAQAKYVSPVADREEKPGEGIASGTVYVVDSTMKVYKKASASSKLLGTLAYGEDVTLLSVEDGWAKVQNAAGTAGYCKYGSLSAENPNVYDKMIYAAREGARVYARPSVETSVVAELALNDRMTLVALVSDSAWGRVRLASGVYGYVLAEECAAKPVEDRVDEPADDVPADDAPADDNNSDLMGDSSPANAIIALGKEQLGKPYVYAASGPDRFDCSGFVYYCFKEVTGIKLGRTAYAQGYDDTYAKISSAGDLKAGDLVFFNTNSEDSDLSDHSGIYIGGGKFIHASSAAARVVISDLTSGYYQRTFSWGRRVL